MQDHDEVETMTMRIAVDSVHGNTLAQQIRTALAQRILSGELAPGTRLKDNEVAALFGTSNTPVREALRELAKDGLVEILPYRGSVVRQVSMEEVAEAFEVRAALACLAARLAAGRATPSLLDSLEALADQYEAATSRGDDAWAVETGARFHRLVIDASGNALLARTLQQLGNHLRLACHVDGRCIQPTAGPTYRAILAALREGDGEKAAALTAEHIGQYRDRIAEVLQQQAIQNG